MSRSSSDASRIRPPLLAENWATRQQTLAELGSAGTWATYGADPNQFNAIEQALSSLHLTVLDGTNSNYVTSAQSRTIWVELNSAADFNNLFGTTLQQYTDPHDPHERLRFLERQSFAAPGLERPGPVVRYRERSAGVQLRAGRFGDPGAGLSERRQRLVAAARPRRAGHCGALPFPAAGAQRGDRHDRPRRARHRLGPGARADQTFQQLLTAYLASIGESGSGTVYVQGANGQSYADGGSGERSLDVGVVSAINPNSNIGLYNGSGYNGNADASTFTAMQSAIWDPSHPAVISNSFGDTESMAPGSPFYAAYQQLFIDAALNNQTLFTALGDGGSGNETANGLTNVEYNVTSPYTVLVGGTSISSFASAQQDPTINTTIVAAALAGDPATIWQLVEGGLTSLPADAAQLQYFVEAVWNEYFVQGTHITGGGYQVNFTSSGGVDPTQSTPAYQLDYGLSPVTADPLAQPGRGAPDVAADAGGNTVYIAPNDDMVGTTAATTAPAPRRRCGPRSRSQLDTIFHDQGLPNLGYMNDLLYIADGDRAGLVQRHHCSATTSLVLRAGRSALRRQRPARSSTPTGFGYHAGPGYDLASGPGHAQRPAAGARADGRSPTRRCRSHRRPDVVDSDGHGGWTSGADQTLLFQTMSRRRRHWSASHAGPDAFGFFSAASGSFAWTNQLAAAVAAARLRSQRWSSCSTSRRRARWRRRMSRRATALAVSIDAAAAPGDAGRR